MRRAQAVLAAAIICSSCANKPTSTATTPQFYTGADFMHYYIPAKSTHTLADMGLDGYVNREFPFVLAEDAIQNKCSIIVTNEPPTHLATVWPRLCKTSYPGDTAEIFSKTRQELGLRVGGYGRARGATCGETKLNENTTAATGCALIVATGGNLDSLENYVSMAAYQAIVATAKSTGVNATPLTTPKDPPNRVFAYLIPEAVNLAYKEFDLITGETARTTTLVLGEYWNVLPFMDNDMRVVNHPLNEGGTWSTYETPHGIVTLLGVSGTYNGDGIVVLLNKIFRLMPNLKEIIYFSSAATLTGAGDIYDVLISPSAYYLTNAQRGIHQRERVAVHSVGGARTNSFRKYVQDMSLHPGLGEGLKIVTGFHVSVPTIMEQTYGLRNDFYALGVTSVDQEASFIAALTSMHPNMTFSPVLFASQYMPGGFKEGENVGGIGGLDHPAATKNKELLGRLIAAYITSAYSKPGAP